MTADPNDAAHYDDCGFDISHHNEDLDFRTLARGGLRKYCFIKITEGRTVKDPRAADHLAGLIDAGFTRLGVYHFAHHGNAADQMRFFLDTFSDLTGNLAGAPPLLFMLDLEVNESDPNPPREADGLAMVENLASRGIANPIIYCGRDFWSQTHDTLAACPHMVAAYNDHPTTALPWRVAGADTYGWDMWQYTGDSLGPWAKELPGGTTGMDLSCFNLQKHPEGLETWWSAQLALTQPRIA